jgi:hypothetical protein
MASTAFNPNLAGLNIRFGPEELCSLALKKAFEFLSHRR